jgi:acetyl-CoA synthetase
MPEQGIHAYVTLKADEVPSETLRRELGSRVRKEIGPIASLDPVQWAPALAKTRSGKVMDGLIRERRAAS